MAWMRETRRLISFAFRSSKDLSTKAVAEEIKPPLKLYGIPGRYASALFVTAAKAKKLDLVEKELKTISEMVERNDTFKNYLRDPTIAKTKKSQGISELMKSFKVSDLTRNLFVVMAENGRLPHAEKVVASFEELLMASRGEVKGTVVSAEPLTADQMKRVRSSITKFVDKGATVQLTEKVDPKILGGLVVSVGDKHIDLSVLSRIKKLESLIAEAL